VETEPESAILPDMATTPTKKIRRRKPDVRRAVQDWLHNDDAAKQFGTAVAAAKKRLMDILEEYGTEDQQGHRWLHFPDDPIDGRIKSIKRERRVFRSMKPSDEVEKFLRDKGLWDQCTETVVVINEDKILELNWGDDPVITNEEMRKYLYDFPEQFAFIAGRIKQ
jgi:hypothetical protein